MDGFYSIWSKPFLNVSKDEFSMRDFEILTLVLSISVWQKYNGLAYLYADRLAIEYFNKCGLSPLFKGGIKEILVDEDIDTKMFWAGGKLFTLKNLEKPMCMIDLDLIVWKNMDGFAESKDILVIHREEISDKIYPDFYNFKFKNGYSLPEYYDKTVLPCNTAMLYIKDLDFTHLYAKKAIEFMKNSMKSDDNLCPMVFAEQRLISILAKEYNKSIGSVFPLSKDIGIQDMFTHLWGHKNVLKFNNDERVNFCKRVIKRLRYEYPASFDIVSKLDNVRIYI